MDDAKPRPANGRRSTIYDIAAETKASASTVSLVLNGSWSPVSHQGGHRPPHPEERAGPRLQRQPQGTRLEALPVGLAGMILPHYRNRFFADLAEAFEAEARQRDLCPIVVSTQRDPDVEVRVTETLLAQQVEFLFIAGVPNPAPLNTLCSAAEVACVNLDLPGDGAPSVVSDNTGGARLLTEALIEKVAGRGGTLVDIAYLGGVGGRICDRRPCRRFSSQALDAAGHRVDDAMRCSGAGIRPRARAGRSKTMPPCGGACRPASWSIRSRLSRGSSPIRVATILRRRLSDLVVACFDWDPFAANLPYDVTMLRQNVETMTRAGLRGPGVGATSRRAAGVVMVEPVRV